MFVLCQKNCETFFSINLAEVNRPLSEKCDRKVGQEQKNDPKNTKEK
jgi:hypothetical protein